MNFSIVFHGMFASSLLHVGFLVEDYYMMLHLAILAALTCT